MEYADGQQDPVIQTAGVPVQHKLRNVADSWKFQERITDRNKKEFQTGTRSIKDIRAADRGKGRQPARTRRTNCWSTSTT